MPETLFGRSSATFSPCQTYRYTLERIWDDQLPHVVFVMLNPSTANEVEDDPTIRRCIGYARRWGHGGLIVVNLFAIRSTDPTLIVRHPFPIGPENDQHIFKACDGADRVIAAWGNHGGHNGRDKHVAVMLQEIGVELECLRLTKSGAPCHPLYMPADVKPEAWRTP